MAAGGHFAIAIFERDKIIQHKTFHKYIIRAKQGTAQSAHDQKTGGKARSAGANLRRQNMLHLKQVSLKSMVWPASHLVLSIENSRVIHRLEKRTSTMFTGIRSSTEFQPTTAIRR
jgi:hypothetical protein